MIKEKLQLVWAWTKRQWKKIITIILGGTVLAAGIVSVIPNNIPEHLQLKVPKDKILFSRDVQGTEIKEYLYISDKKVPQAIYNGKTEVVEKRTKNAQFFLKEKRGKVEEWQGRFYAGEPFYKDDNEWFQTETATTTKEAFEEQTKIRFLERLFFPKALADTDPFYTGAGDGYVFNSSAGQPSQANWDTAHDNTTGAAAEDGVGLAHLAATELWGADNLIRIYRGFLPIDTSGLGADAIVTAAVLKLYIVSKQDAYNGDGYDYMAIVQTDQPNSAVLTTADFNNCGATNNPDKGSADIDISGMPTGSYQDFTLNLTGRGWIEIEGTTMLGIREGHDIQDNFPGDPGEVNKYSRIKIYFSEQGGTSEDPYLEITYTLPVEAVEAQMQTQIIQLQ